MNKLSIDLFNHITHLLDLSGGSRNQEITISKEGFRELLPYLEKDIPEFPFNGYIFKLEIK